jgi:3-oxoacyl-[acyl-carrier protein] reductase
MNHEFDNKEEFEGKIVAITGAAGDIGQPLADEFRRLGGEVFATDLRDTEVSNFTPGDISDPTFVTQWIDQIVGQTGRVDVLVNVAGICPRTPLDDITAEEWDQVLTVNVRSVFLASQAALKTMIPQKGGAIVNLASLAGKVGGIAVGAHYSSSKAAIVGLTKSLARNGAAHAVRANAVAPGIIDTSRTAPAGPDGIEQLKQSIPMRRLGSVAEVIGPIVFLASSKAAYITGATLDINGGLLMD